MYPLLLQIDPLVEWLLHYSPLALVAFVSGFSCVIVYRWVDKNILTKIERTEKDIAALNHGQTEIKAVSMDISKVATESQSEIKGLIEGHREVKGVTTELSKSLSILKDVVADNSKHIAQLITFLNSENKKFKYELFVSKSPIRLSETGQDILNNYLMKQMIDTNWALISAELSTKNNYTSLDVEQNAVLTLFGLVDNPLFNEVKLKIYNNPFFKYQLSDGSGSDEVQVDIPLILNIGSLYVRDQFLKEHPEIPSQ